MAQEVSEYFPLELVTSRMLGIYETLLGVVMKPVENPHVWHEEVCLQPCRGPTCNPMPHFMRGCVGVGACARGRSPCSRCTTSPARMARQAGCWATSTWTCSPAPASMAMRAACPCSVVQAPTRTVRRIVPGAVSERRVRSRVVTVVWRTFRDSQAYCGGRYGGQLPEATCGRSVAAAASRGGDVRALTRRCTCLGVCVSPRPCHCQLLPRVRTRHAPPAVRYRVSRQAPTVMAHA